LDALKIGPGQKLDQINNGPFEKVVQFLTDRSDRPTNQDHPNLRISINHFK
jgi:hypothetical protein